MKLVITVNPSGFVYVDRHPDEELESFRHKPDVILLHNCDNVVDVAAQADRINEGYKYVCFVFDLKD